MLKVPTATEVHRAMDGRLFSEIPINDIYFDLRSALYNAEEVEVPDRLLDSNVVVNEAEAVKEPESIEEDDGQPSDLKEHEDFAQDNIPERDEFEP